MRRVRIGLGVVLILGLTGSVLDAQPSRQLWVSVADSNGAAITGLSADKFTVSEDGVKCRTLKAEPIEWPVKLTVLVDNGGKSSDYLINLRNGLLGLFKEVPNGVEASLLTFAPQPRWVVRPTKDGEQLAKGVSRIAPDPGGGKFFDGLLEAVDRAAKDDSKFFPVFVMAVSTFGNRDEPIASKYERLQKELVDRAATVHVVLLSVASENVGAVTGAFQTHIGNQVANLTGGRYENISAASRLDTLLPEIGKQIARSVAKQKYEYRLTYEAPKGAKEPKDILVDVAVSGATIDVSADGHLP
jgi:hypothetical protein